MERMIQKVTTGFPPPKCITYEVHLAELIYQSNLRMCMYAEIGTNDQKKMVQDGHISILNLC